MSIDNSVLFLSPCCNVSSFLVKNEIKLMVSVLTYLFQENMDQAWVSVTKTSI